MLYRPLIIGEASGSLGATVFSHNHGGLYTRHRTKPTDPMTAEQIACRDAMAQIEERWSLTLTEDQRATWRAFAEHNPRPNRLGQNRPIDGRAYFTRVNFYQVQASIRLSTSPTWFDVPPSYGATPPDTTVWTPGSGAANMFYTLNHADEWWNDTGGVLYVYVSPPLAPTQRYFRGPFTLVAAIPAAAADDSVALPVIANSPQGLVVRTVAHWYNGLPSVARLVRANT